MGSLLMLLAKRKPPVQGTGDFNPIQFLAANAVAYWKMDGGGGGWAANEPDITGRGNVLAPFQGGDSDVVTGKVGDARSIFASDPNYLSRSSTSDLSVGSGDFIIATWVKPNGADQYSVLSKGDAGDGNPEYWLALYDDAGAAEARFYVSDAEGQNQSVETSYGFAVGSWALVIARISGDTLYLRINNGAVDEATAGAPFGTLAQGGDFLIGGMPSAGVFYDGLIDDTLVVKTSTPMSSDDFDALSSYLWSGGNGLDLSFIF